MKRQPKFVGSHKSWRGVRLSERHPVRFVLRTTSSTPVGSTTRSSPVAPGGDADMKKAKKSLRSTGESPGGVSTWLSEATNGGTGGSTQRFSGGFIQSLGEVELGGVRASSFR